MALNVFLKATCPEVKYSCRLCHYCQSFHTHLLQEIILGFGETKGIMCEEECILSQVGPVSIISTLMYQGSATVSMHSHRHLRHPQHLQELSNLFGHRTRHPPVRHSPKVSVTQALLLPQKERLCHLIKYCKPQSNN